MKPKTINMIVGILAVFTLLSIAVTAFSDPAVKFFSKIVLYSLLPIVGVFAVTNFLMKQGNSVRNIIVWIIRIILIMLCYMHTGSLICKMVLDIPDAISANYKKVTGKPTNISIERSGKTAEEVFFIGNIKFNVDYHDFEEFEKNLDYEITYLPVSKYVISIKKFIDN
jgi:hypothetical protein